MSVYVYGVVLEELGPDHYRAQPVGEGQGLWALNWANANAVAVLGMLGLYREGDSLMGECTVPEARRAWMRAMARFDRLVPQYVREEQAAGGGRSVVFGCDRAYLQRQLAAWVVLCTQAQAAGATHIAWW